MGLMPEKLSSKDKMLLIGAVVALAAGGAGYYFISRAPVNTDVSTPAATNAATTPTDPAKPQDKKPLTVEETLPPPTGGGPRSNPEYKDGGK